MVVNREHVGVTPSGMTFGDLASVTGGGAQTPGFVGVGRLYLTSPKFISGDGGIQRIVWMPKQLKEEIADRLMPALEKAGMADLWDKIATEENADEPEALVEYLTSVGHPALEMEAAV